jgi:large subunit ribosomal protein L4
MSLVGETPSAKVALSALRQISDRKNFLVVIPNKDVITLKSLRNLDNVHIIEAGQLNTYDVLCSDDVVFLKDAYDQFIAPRPTGRGAKAVATSTDAAAEQETNA